MAQLHDELPIEIAEKLAYLAELDAKIERNERLAAAALEKASANEGKADKALKNAALYEGRAQKARQERDAEERALSNLQLDRRKEEERLERLREQQAAILAENQRQAELGDQIAQENGLLAEKGRQRVEALTAEVAGLKTKSARLSADAQEQEAFIADAERIADTHWDRASAAMDALSHAEAQRKAVEGEAAQIRETALREAQEAADALLAQAQDQGVKEALRVTEEVSKRLEEQLLTEGQKALHNAERERDSWKAAFELLRDAVKALIPESMYQKVKESFMGAWSKHPDNPEREPEPPPPPYSAGRSVP